MAAPPHRHDVPHARNALVESTVSGPVIQAGSIGHLSVHHAAAPDSPPQAPPSHDAWTGLALASSVWEHVPPGRDTSAHRHHTAEVTAALAALREEAEQRLTDDPWQDPDLVRRFTERLEWLLGEPGGGEPLDLYPAEAALLVLTPFLHRTLALRVAADHSGVAPATLAPVADPSPDRVSFEAYAREQHLLVTRALRRPEAAGPLGWWLFHRWLARREEPSLPDAVGQLLATGPLRDAARPLGDVLSPTRIGALLHGLRRGPGVCHPEHLGALPPDDRVAGPGHQRVRDQRLALLTALAYGASVEMTALPDIVAEHLGIPHPVDLAELRGTLERADWGGSPALPVLRAQCPHEAVIEALRAYTSRLDETLHAVHRTVRERITQPVPQLPSRLSADGVVPSSGTLTGWARFRLDEGRVRDLLTGIQLYKDRDLALRELYQNALDACRHRRARTAYLDRTHLASYAYEGRIEFAQGRDADGRAYVECRDNGIGMGDAELRGVFSQAGARFAEQPDFRLEQAAWRQLDPPVPFFPNSRFGIGVLSYFMLADEISVTTCRMHPDGTPGPLLEVSIFGPGHLFRIVEAAARGAEPGTRVRLYLREDGAERPDDWSCVPALERLLGIAEFPTTAQDGERESVWRAGELRARAGQAGEQFGLNAHGALVPWSGAPDGAQVVWCEQGGGLLVDGLVVQPSLRRGVFSGTGAGLTGAVVNLSGARAPERLSADRREVLDELSGPVGALLTEAADDLLASEQALPTFEWISRVADGSLRLADVLAAATIAAGRHLRYQSVRFDTAQTGCLPGDASLSFLPITRGISLPTTMGVLGEPPDSLFLWRLLAHRPNKSLDALTALCPELGAAGPVLPAMPSDQALLTPRGSWRGAMTPSRTLAAQLAARLERPLATVEDRAARLGLSTAGRGLPAPGPSAFRAGQEAGDPLLMRDVQDPGPGKRLWLDPGEPVPPGHLAQAALRLGTPVPEAAAALRSYGLEVEPAALPSAPDEAALVVLSARADGHWPWLSLSEPVPPGQVVAAAHKRGCTLAEALAELVSFGFRPPRPFPADAHADDRLLLYDFWDARFPLPSEPFPYHCLFESVERTGDGLEEALARLRAYGFDVPFRLPDPFTPLDEALLQVDGAFHWWGLQAGAEVPYAHVVAASRTLAASHHEVAARLRAYGLRVPLRDLPPGLSFAKALDLLFSGFSDDDAFRDAESEVSLQEALTLSGTLRAGLPQVVSWLDALGVPVVDIGETLRTALAHVPFADAAPQARGERECDPGP
ncbi:ATP-binding protein [Streptomyces sp. NPDC056411]|uniref:wHTH domain-containing protein n=1 Tax=Streptomyces sp. NPDC056411 TaxID=3345813 RepID=UPI0035E37840